VNASSPHAPIVSSRAAYAGVLAGAGGHEIEASSRADDGAAPAVAIYASPPYDMDVPALGVARLSINLSHSRVTGQLAGERVRSFVARRHSLFLTPAGADAHWRKEQPSRHINIYFDDRQSAPLLNATLPGLAPLFEMLAAELTDAAAFAAEAVDSLARLILVRLLRRATDTAANPLTPALLARLRDFVRAHLDQQLLVADLARVAGLPSNRFAQAFAASSGHSPHQFVIAQRLQCASDLLQRSSSPLADVAAACGFASQQHMTQLMRRRLGTTPARHRAASAAR
jgi:AraC family transcriptional regulator